jgi:hypothetical protein
MFLNLSFICKKNHILLIIKALTQKSTKRKKEKKSITISSPHNCFPQVAKSNFEFLPPMFHVMLGRKKIG